MNQTLGDWLNTLEGADLLRRVPEETPIGQLAEIVDRNYRYATLFERVRGYDMPVVANTFSNRKMMALALGTGEDGILDALRERRRQRIAPVPVKEAPCKEVIEVGDDVDLASLPLHLQHGLDGAPYISAAVVVAKDPRRGVSNLGVYRMMYRTRNETGVDVTAPHKLRHYYEEACKLGQPLEVAAILGLPAIDILASLASAPLDMDEFEVLGGFRGAPAELIKCETVDLHVPANAEMVLEGEMAPAGWIADEGPYGEFTGTYGGGLKRNPTIRIKAITRRRNALFLSATHGGRHPGWTDVHVLFPMIELDLTAALEQAGLDVRAMRALPASSGMWAVASIKPISKGDAKNALALMLSASKQAFPKYAVVVDEDVDIFDDEQVYWAMTWRAQPDLDVMILRDMKAVPLDPSLPSSMPPVTTAKMGIDATIPIGRSRADFEICLPPQIDVAASPAGSLENAEIEAGMLEMIAVRPVYFKEFIDAFGDARHRQILGCFGRLRERGLLARDDRGRYVAAEPDDPGGAGTGGHR